MKKKEWEIEEELSIMAAERGCDREMEWDGCPNCPCYERCWLDIEKRGAGRIPMNFRDGTGGRRMLPQYQGKSTLDLIIEGKRTATSRDWTKSYNRLSLEIGEIIVFFNDKGESVACRVTKVPYPLSEISAEKWSKLECWEPDRFELLKSKGYWQFQFELV